MATLLTTNKLPPEQRLAYWIEMICDVYVQLECSEVDPISFHGEILSHSIANLHVSRVSSVGQRVIRSPQLVSQSVEDDIIISLQTSGNCLITQDSRYAFLKPGDFAIYDSTRPYNLSFSSDFNQFVLKVSGGLIRSMIRDIENLTARTVSGEAGAGYLLIPLVQSLFDQIDELATASAASIAQGIINILVGGLKSLPACTSIITTSLEDYHLARIKQQIELRLSEPKLKIDSIAQELDISVSHLHRIFHSQEQSASQYLWNRRLEKISQDLLDPLCSRASVSEIAYSWGFNDAAHFSRAFKSRYGCSPREWRMQTKN